MTDTEIASLLDARDKICLTASLLEIPADTRSIDVLLSTVPSGRNNRIDLALGRSCAKLPDYYDAVSVQVVTALERAYIVNQSELDPRVILDMQERCAETSRGEDYDSLTETY